MSILNIGDPAPEFHLKGIDGKVHSLADLRGFRATVLFFTELENEYWHKYETSIIELQNRVRQYDVRFAAIFVSQADDDRSQTIKSMTDRAKDNGYNFPIVLDYLQEYVGDFGVERIPESFLLNHNLHLLYRGAIDNRFESGHTKRVSYLSDAIEALLENREIEIKETQVVGKAIRWFEPPG